MKLREVPEPVFDPPPLELLHWSPRFHVAAEWARTGIPQPRPGVPAGQDVYASRGEWVAARRRWEARHGQAIAGWYAEAMAGARAEYGLDGFAAMRPYRPDPDQEPPFDPSGEW